MNLLVGYSGEQQLITIGTGNVEPEPGTLTRPALGGRGEKPAIDEKPLVARRRERVHELRSHFVAARTDTRTDRGDDIGRLRPELVRQRIERRDRRTRGGASPAGVYGGHNPARAIG